VETSTITGEPEVTPAASAQRRTALVVLANADAPARGSSSHTLDGLDVVTFRRGEHMVVRDGRTLVLSLDDNRMSRDHGQLVRGDSGWLLDDQSSKNASVVDGVVTRRTRLEDGSLIELGRSFLLFRDYVCDAAPPHLAADVSASQLPVLPSTLSTFSPSLSRDYLSLARLSTSGVSIVLLGETGTGKEVVATALHELSRRSGSFVAINCGALPETLLEAELFGHRRGAFSGATSERRGLVRSADGGTLFLDEVGDLPRASQVALLRVLQEREVVPLGADRAEPVDVRVIAATLRSLDGDAGFRPDLYARLAGHVVTLPPLRERREDLGLLLATLLTRIADGREIRFSPPAMRALFRYRWPLNIRELEQALTTAIALATTNTIDLDQLPKTVRERQSANAPTKSPQTLDDDDRELRTRLESLLQEHGGNVVAVAQALQKKRSQIYKWVHRLSIDLERFRA
jgi:transcriptional regulator of acetoin/glycerol metabolism